jgi:uncharacterized protein (TIGR02996 family)
MSERNAFLEALAENEDDTTTRLVYADWLDERGEHEEADRQRKWPAAKAWLVLFWRSCNPDGEADFDGEVPDPDDDNPYAYLGISYETLLELGRRAVENADQLGIGFYCGANETMMEALRAHSREFWKNWSVVTGVPLPPNVADRSFFSCSC